MKARALLYVVLVAAGAALTAEGVYIKAKAGVAQWLIGHAWERRQPGRPPPKPWSWADTAAVARLEIPELGVDRYVMRDASGESLAFGPGAVYLDPAALPGGHIVVAGHRDSHFRFLRHLQPGTRITFTGYRGARADYIVTETRIVDLGRGAPPRSDFEDMLSLVTCFPFDTLVPGGPLRYVVNARLATS